MADLQTTIEISVELNRFFNVDLFQRGYYQVQVALKTLPKTLVRVEVNDKKISVQKEGSSESSNFQQSCIGKSRKFQILYRNEEVDIEEVFIFRIYALVESTKLEKNLENLDLRLDVQLWCNSEEEHMEADAEMKLASSRTLLLHFSPTKGLHHFLPVVFDYFHLAAMEVVIHGTVLSFNQPNLTYQKPQKSGKGSDQQSLETVYFGQKSTTPVSPPSNVTSNNVHLQQAHLRHKRICSILLSVQESLQDYLQQYVALVPGCKFQLVSKDCLTRLEEIEMKIQGVVNKDALIQTALADITQLSAENVLLWAQFQLFAIKQPQVHLHLATEHHNLRVRRFAEGFFTVEHNKSSCLSCYDPGFHGHSSLATMVKNSPYFCNLPSLPVECIELDGDENSLPIIFEDIFQDYRASPPQMYKKSTNITTDGTIVGFSREHSSSNSSLASDRGTPPHLRRRKSSKKFIKNLKPEGFKRPLSHNCKDAKLETLPTPSGVATLIGYRKTPVPEDVSSGPHLTGQLERAQSLPQPSDLPSVCLNYAGGESIPDRDIYQPCMIASATTTPVTGGVCEPGVVCELNMSTIPDYDKTNHISTSSCVTLAESPSIYLKPQSSDSSLTVASSAPTAPEKDNFIVSSLNVNQSSQSDLQSSSKLSPYHNSSSKLSSPATQSNTIITSSQLNSLVEDISQALGEKEPTSLENMTAVVSSYEHDNGFIIDGKNIPNGLDDVLCAYKNDFGICKQDLGVAKNDCSISKVISLSKDNNVVLNNVFDISKQNGDSSKQDCSISKQDCSISKPDCDTSKQESGTSKQNSDTSKQDCSISKQDCSISKPDCDTSKQDCSISKQECGTSKQNGDTFKQDCSNSKPDFNTSKQDCSNSKQDCSNSKPDCDISQPSSNSIVLNDSSSNPSFSQDQDKSTPLVDNASDISQTAVSKTNSSAISNTSFHGKTSPSAPVSETSSVAVQNTGIIIKTVADKLTGTSSSVVNSTADPKQKLTVMELLKEEYRISLQGGPAEPPVLNSSTPQLLTNPVESSTFSGHRAASDSDILKNSEEKQRTTQTESQEPSKTISEAVEMRRALLTSSSSYPELSHSTKPELPRLVSVVGDPTVNFAQLRKKLKQQMDFSGYLYSEFPVLASSIPYFQVPGDVDESSSGLHLIVCVHGLDGNSADLRLVRTYIEMSLPGFKLEFLMSERNQQDTFADFDKMTDRLIEEILTFLDTSGLQVTRISFVGHSLGNIIIRSTLSRPEMSHLLPKLYTFLSLSGPHLGTLYNASGLVNMGMWFMQKLKKSGSLLQLSLKDHSDPRQTFLYRLSQKPVLQYFKHILLVGSHQDRYVPYHSSRIEICRSAQKDTTVIGAVYREMVQYILEPIIQAPHCTLIRYDVYHALPSTANTMIGRAAHIAVLDSEIFIEKFLAVTGLKYFQ